MLDTILNSLYPLKCVFCADTLPVSAPIGVCGCCAELIPYFAGNFLFEDKARGANNCDKIICAMEFTHFVRGAISRFKFGGRRDYGIALAAILCDRIGRTGDPREDYDLVTCIPLSRARMFERGYNQAAELAKYVSSYFNIAYAGDLLLRDENALRQSTLRRGERYENAKISYHVNVSKARSYSLNAARVLLIDDIATSMATINACGAIIKSAGAPEVTGAVLAAVM